MTKLLIFAFNFRFSDLASLTTVCLMLTQLMNIMSMSSCSHWKLQELALDVGKCHTGV